MGHGAAATMAEAAKGLSREVAQDLDEVAEKLGEDHGGGLRGPSTERGNGGNAPSDG